MPLDHENVMRLQTPERYVLGELKPEEREEFEEHMADCAVCMQELAVADMFAANASAVFADRASERATVKSAGWFEFLRPRAFPVLAFSGILNLALLGFVGYGVTRMANGPDLRPGLSELFTVLPPARSGQGQIFLVDRSIAYATLQFDLPRPYQRYSYSLDGGGNRPVDVTPPSGSETLPLTVALAGMAPGDHKFRLTGWDGQRTVEIGACIVRVGTGN